MKTAKKIVMDADMIIIHYVWIAAKVENLWSGMTLTKIQCLKCDKILESKYTHDYNVCGCDNQTMIDGGNEYLRIGGKEIKYIKILEGVKQ